MDGTYIFFDIESANSFEGTGHICSFGYAVCDGSFAVLESDDIVMNPRAPFDPMLFAEHSRCRLAYPQEHFLAQPDFSAQYGRIRSLLLAPGRTAVGFAVENDIHFLISACEQFRTEQLLFCAYDLHAIADKLNGAHNGLAGWLDFYGIDASGLRTHRSCDDALMTMLLAQKLCALENCPPAEFFARHGFALRSVEKSLEHARMRRYKKYMDQKIALLYGKRNPAPATTRLAGRYKVSLSARRDLDQCYRILRLVYENGGVLVNRAESGCTYVMEDAKHPADWMRGKRAASMRFIRVRDLFRALDLPEPPFCMQRAEVPDVPDAAPTL